ncbi:MAG: hypothetical protein ACRD0D_01535 [Acidimicrobiales bacterium]
MQHHRLPPWAERYWPLLRSVLLFAGGLAGVAHEAVARDSERPVLLGVYTVMMGLPLLAGNGRRDQHNGAVPPTAGTGG